MGIGKNSWKFALGAVALRNRTQAELDKGATAADVNASELAFFKSNAALNALSASDKESHLGVSALVNRLVTIQAERVKEALPGIIKAVGARLKEQLTLLSKLPPECKTESECTLAFVEIINKLDARIQEVCKADYSRVKDFSLASEVIEGKASKLHMMPRLQEFFDKFDKRVREVESTPIFADEFRKRIRDAMEETKGVALPDCLSDEIFADLVGTAVDDMREPALDLIEAVFKYTTDFCAALRVEYISKVPALESVCGVAIDDFLENARICCINHVKEQLKLEADPYVLNDCEYCNDWLRMLQLFDTSSY